MWWNDMSTLQQVTFVIACAATAILIFQIIFMLVGGSSDADIPGGASDADVSGGVTDYDGGGAFDPDLNNVSLSDTGDDIPTGGKSGGASMPFGLRLLSLRSIIAFAAVGSWVCYTLCYVLDWYFAAIIAVICGMAAALLGMEKLQSTGNINPSNAIGKTGTVYLTVPPARSGSGKVNVLIQERYAEYDAVTDGDEIPTAAEIKVTGCINGNVLVVEKYKKPSITVTTE